MCVSMPKKQKDFIEKRTVPFRTLNVETGKIDNAPAGDIQEISEEAKNDVVFFTRPNKYGAIEVQLKSDKMAKNYAT